VTVQAKFEVASITHHAGGCSEVLMRPITKQWPVPDDHPNKRFWDATPSGQLQMMMTAKGAAHYFKPGVEYLLTFEEMPAPAPAPMLTKEEFFHGKT
jgi:hypothetical protein